MRTAVLFTLLVASVSAQFKGSQGHKGAAVGHGASPTPSVCEICPDLVPQCPSGTHAECTPATGCTYQCVCDVCPFVEQQCPPNQENQCTPQTGCTFQCVHKGNANGAHLGCSSNDDCNNGYCGNDGNCYPYAGAGDQCGGFVQNAPQCAPGYFCSLNPNTPDLPGQCVAEGAQPGCSSNDDCNNEFCGNDGNCYPYAGAGDQCGGFVENAPQCAPGYFCSHLPNNPDLPGQCVADTCSTNDDCNNGYCGNDGNCYPYAGAGDQCGGFVQNAPQCAPGYDCVANHNHPDLPGQCVARHGKNHP